MFRYALVQRFDKRCNPVMFEHNGSGQAHVKMTGPPEIETIIGEMVTNGVLQMLNDILSIGN